MSLSCASLFSAIALWTLCMTVSVSGATEMLHLNEGSMQAAPRNSSNSSTSVPGAPRERAITAAEITALVDYHNLVRSEVFAPAANMEYMVWNETVASLAAYWASQCTWAHGPSDVLKFNGQNMAFSSSSSSPVIDLAKSWNAERFSYYFPNCLGSVCGHYTQMVWATSTQLGCAVKAVQTSLCPGEFGNSPPFWSATIIPRNMGGLAPYYPGKPCSACPLRYRGSCQNNLCTKMSK